MKVQFNPSTISFISRLLHHGMFPSELLLEVVCIIRCINYESSWYEMMKIHIDQQRNSTQFSIECTPPTGDHLSSQPIEKVTLLDSFMKILVSQPAYYMTERLRTVIVDVCYRWLYKWRPGNWWEMTENPNRPPLGNRNGEPDRRSKENERMKSDCNWWKLSDATTQEWDCR